MSFGQGSVPACLRKTGKLQQGKFLRTSWSNICQEGLSTTDPAHKLWDWPCGVPSSPLLCQPINGPTAKWEFAQYIISLSDQSHPLQSRLLWLSCQEKKLMVELGICDRNSFVYKRWTKPSCTESSRNPTAEANFFAFSFQTPFSQLADQKHSQRSFELVYPQCWVKLHLVFFYCLLWLLSIFLLFPFLKTPKSSPAFLPPCITLSLCTCVSILWRIPDYVEAFHFFQSVLSIIRSEGGYLNIHIQKDLIQIKPILWMTKNSLQTVKWQHLQATKMT